MSEGLTANGWVTPTFETILDRINNRLKTSIGNVITTPDSGLGQLTNIMATEAEDLWQQGENVYNSQYPSTANGSSLDNVLQFNGLERQQATRTIVKAILEGDEGTIVPSLSQAQLNNSTEIFEQQGALTITKNNMFKWSIQVNASVTDSYDISLVQGSITVNGNYASPGGESTSTIAAGVVADLLTDGNFSTLYNYTLVGDTITIWASDTAETFVGTRDNLFDDIEIWSPVDYRAVNYGAIVANINSLTIIITPISGWNSIDNEIVGFTGSETEEDYEARLRQQESLQIIGAATIEAIRARLIDEIDTVTNAIVFENETDSIVSGRPPHSIECLIVGNGTSQEDTEIANKIWEVKAGGIQTYGSESEIITDSQGFSHTIYFSRPTQQYGHIRVVVTQDPETTFPVDGLSQIQSNLLTYCQSNYKLGKDIIYQSLFNPIYAVSGIASVVLDIDVTPNPGDTPSYVQINITVADDVNTNWDLTRILVS